jgi:hypothetical protein
MTNSETALDRLLQALGACAEARGWARGKTLSAAWTECPRAEWMLWLAGRMADEPGWPTRQQVVLAAAACAETALPFAGHLRPVCEETLAVARGWAHGEATAEELRTAAADADAEADAAEGADAEGADAAVAAAAAAEAAHAAAAAAYAADGGAADGVGGAPAAAAVAAAAHAVGAVAAYHAAARMADTVRRMLRVPSELACSE